MIDAEACLVLLHVVVGSGSDTEGGDAIVLG